jgi:excisionase family DNA binding protein
MSMMNLGDLPPILSKKECAELLRLTERSIDAMRQAGKLPSFRIGASVRFHREHVLALIPRRPMFGHALPVAAE